MRIFRKQQGGGEGEIVHETGCLFQADAFKESFAHFSGNLLIVGIYPDYFTEISQKGIGPADVFQRPR